MEIIIILLIAVEVTIVLIREGHELAKLLKSYITPEEVSADTFSEASKSETDYFGQVVDMAPRIGQALELETEGLQSEGRRLV
jgi:hypothetical protein